MLESVVNIPSFPLYAFMACTATLQLFCGLSRAREQARLMKRVLSNRSCRRSTNGPDSFKIITVIHLTLHLSSAVREYPSVSLQSPAVTTKTPV